MPDTDDDQSVELEPDQWEQGDDDTEAARERQEIQARAEAGKDLSRGLAESDAERRAEEKDQEVQQDEEDLKAHTERVERSVKDQQELDEHRDRAEVAEATRAREIAFADDAAATARQYRGLAATGRQQELSLQARGQHKQDEAAAHPGELGSDELAAEGRRNVRASELTSYQVNSDLDRARAYDDLADEHRSKAWQAQPSASEAVRKAPDEPPEAQLPQARRHVRGPGRTRTKQGKPVKPNRASEPDLDL